MLLHASSVAIQGCAVLLTGAAGIGKSDLALRLIDAGAELIADDQTLLHCENNILYASAPAAIAGMMEIRHIGLLKMPFTTNIPVRLIIELTPLGLELPRLPDPETVCLLEQNVRRVRLPSFAASTPAKIRALLKNL